MCRPVALSPLVACLHEQGRKEGAAQAGATASRESSTSRLVVAVAVEHATALEGQTKGSVCDGAHAADDLSRVVLGGVFGRFAVELVDEELSAAILARHPPQLFDEDAIAEGVEADQLPLVREPHDPQRSRSARRYRSPASLSGHLIGGRWSD